MLEAVSSEEDYAAQGGSALEADIPTRAEPVTGVRPSLPPAALIDGTYEVVGKLGEGGMGAVWRAHDQRLGRDVAVKVVRDDLAGNPELKKRLQHEAQAMARVRHENVVSIHAFGEHEGRPYFVMEYVPGETVMERLARCPDQRLPFDEAMRIIDAAARGLQAIHAAGAVHRDVKPANILLGVDGRIALADFGLASTVDPTDRFSGRIEGTLDYLAPECINVEAGDDPRQPAADIYALAVTAYELLTGQLPFEADSMSDTLTQHLYQPPRALSDVAPQLTARFDASVGQALAKEPSDRPATAEEFRLAMRRAAGHADSGADVLRFLVVDDDPVFRSLMRAALSDGFPDAEVHCFAGPAEALSALEHGGYSMAFVDLHMPGINGVEWVAAANDNDTSQSPPVVVISGEGGAKDWALLSRLGVRSFMLKPLDPALLVSVVAHALDHAA